MYKVTKTYYEGSSLIDFLEACLKALGTEGDSFGELRVEHDGVSMAMISYCEMLGELMRKYEKAKASHAAT